MGDLNSARDFLDVVDVCSAYLRLLDFPSGVRDKRVFNIASGRSVKISKILEILLSLSESTISIENDIARMRPSDIEVASGSCESLHSACGWAPTIPLADTLKSVLDYWRSKVRR